MIQYDGDSGDQDLFRDGRDPVTDGLVGLAAGDAFGVPVEFMSRAEVRALDIRDMVGKDSGLAFASRWGDLIPSGAWSDDTSMTIAAMESVIRHGGKIDYTDIMNQFLAWWDRGEYASLAFPFGLGTNISFALERFRRGIPALECGGKGFMDNGNGALMRIFPFSMICILRNLSPDRALGLIRRSAGLTHGHAINAMSCFIYTLFLDGCLRTGNPEAAYREAVTDRIPYFCSAFPEQAVRAHEMILSRLGQSDFDPDSIPESGYVADSLATALYSILHTGNYEDAVRMAVNFGYDTDTNAAITGSIAGAMYGMGQIPERWLSRLRKKEELLRIGRQFSECAVPGSASSTDP